MATMVYLGFTELSNYILNYKNPTFDGFVNKYQEVLAQFSVYSIAMSPETYYGLWRTRFVKRSRDLRPRLCLKPMKYERRVWTANYTELSQLRSTLQTTRIEALAGLQAAMQQAGSSLRSTFEPNITQEQTIMTSAQFGSEERQSFNDVVSEISESDRLIQCFLHYTDGQAFDNHEREFLVQMSAKDGSISNRLLAKAAKNLLSEAGWDNNTDVNTKLLLSSIANLISPTSREILEHILMPEQLETIKSIQAPEISGLPQDAINILDNLIPDSDNDNTVVINGNDVLEKVLQLQADHCKSKKDDVYKMLNILQLVINQFDDWGSEDIDSEATFYRRFAILLDALFRNTTVKMKDGECVTQTSKDTIVILQSLMNSLTSTRQQNNHRTKVDLLATTFLDKDYYELSSCEWKREAASNSSLLMQQGKNLRTNASILSKLVKMDSSKYTVAMDWCGARGYAYIMSFQEKAYIAKPLTELMIPKRPSQLQAFKKTIKFLFQWKNFLINMAARIDTVQSSKDGDLRGVVSIDNNNTVVETPNVVIMPSRARKRSIDQVYDGETSDSSRHESE